MGVSFLAHFAVESGNDLFFDGKYGAVSGEKTIAMDRRSVVIHAPIVGAAAAVPTNVMHAIKNTVAVDHSLLARMKKGTTGYYRTTLLRFVNGSAASEDIGNI